MAEWISPSDESPKNGESVDIKDGNGTVRKNVAFENGVFWKKRNLHGGGNAWIVTAWRSKETKIGKKQTYEDTAQNSPIDREDR